MRLETSRPDFDVWQYDVPPTPYTILSHDRVHCLDAALGIPQVEPLKIDRTTTRTACLICVHRLLTHTQISHDMYLVLHQDYLVPERLIV